MTSRGRLAHSDEPVADQAEHHPSRPLPRDALRGHPARGRRRDHHARPRHGHRVDPRPRACDLPHGGRARRASRRTPDGSPRPRSGDRRRLRDRSGRLRAHGSRLSRRQRAARDPRLHRRRGDERRRPPGTDGRGGHVPAGEEGESDLLRALRCALRRGARPARLPSALRREGLRAGHARHPLVRRCPPWRSSG